jgi:tRNA (Thr-GGU) A37 N-methylase
MRPIGNVRSPYENTREVPKGLGTKHSAEGVLEINPELEVGLTDIEGFSPVRDLGLRSLRGRRTHRQAADR